MLSEAGDPVEEPEGREQAEAKDMVVLKVEEEDDFVRKRQEVWKMRMGDKIFECKIKGILKICFKLRIHNKSYLCLQSKKIFWSTLSDTYYF